MRVGNALKNALAISLVTVSRGQAGPNPAHLEGNSKAQLHGGLDQV